MSERIRESGSRWWEELKGDRFGCNWPVTRKHYGLIAGGGLIAVVCDKYGVYSIGYYLCYGNDEAKFFQQITMGRTARTQTISSAMEEAEEAWRKWLKEKLEYYSDLWRKFEGETP